MAGHRYLVALGANMRHPRHGAPRAVLAAALRALDADALHLLAASPMIETAPLGPSRRRYVNGAALVESHHAPTEMLRELHRIEYRFGRRRRGQAWDSRVLDLDIVLWSGGACTDREGLVVPHPRFRERRFVLDPAAAIAGRWRDPLTGLSIRQLRARLTKPRLTPR